MTTIFLMVEWFFCFFFFFCWNESQKIKNPAKFLFFVVVVVVVVYLKIHPFLFFSHTHRIYKENFSNLHSDLAVVLDSDSGPKKTCLYSFIFSFIYLFCVFKKLYFHQFSTWLQHNFFFEKFFVLNPNSVLVFCNNDFKMNFLILERENLIRK